MDFSTNQCAIFSVFVAIALPILSACQPLQNNIEAPISQPSEEVIPTPTLSEEKTIKLGILSIDSAVSVNQRYSPLVEYLETTLDQEFELVSLTQDTQFSKVAQKAIDFTTTNPLSAVQVRRLHGTEFLVTHSRPRTGTQFSGLIVVEAESDIETLEDLRGKRGACVNFQTAAAGCTFQVFHLLERGIDPYADFASFTENKSQDNIVLGVLNGTLDFGFIRTGQLEKMVRTGLIASKDELRVLEPINDGFFYEHTTALYPEWPIAALPHVDQDLKNSVQEALLNVPSDHPALTAIGIESFEPAVDYGALDQLIERLELKTWDVKSAPES
ncbi:phosphate/phosphite/phosphonate ABC transporter substrate-binding protein [[Limnothrix rosea] IAM M-220]|uniref:phosphate/phosphite/phosphonate ABC transporter substrate-binding protein n=1 Tax=[Limnothrix rosea] IAM M-220 TaxID=454133 RepID=UPI0009648371|nr:phosphate/phosphite/phosphonate ABC transporter substrate-binding protein [[Limnothrix rosea] IAM M-220]OKH19046.1 phosphate ABC transporter substrate-binding protein [[Limnothrix rosea] IAM M-220]